MYIIIVGAGLIGRSFVNLALKNNHNMTVIEENKERARSLLQKYDITVLNADIATGDIFQEANIQKADILVATTSDDSVNLMAMFLGKEHGVKNLITLINNQHHQAIFERLGVKVVVSPEKIIAQQLYDFMKEADD
ncbi:MAG: TrkA family potassium uptake protein [Jaaginema sp. PMC 1079.18]|nr:TrkA family potassium uptake protein [Jaaginema sp. PMC 1080.18]MEC4849380.1 TrkA family potassium uptake protein [Jaaginema sp. PMC 1079.18]MEC4865413.1 TrkA family potassium uptake protein [Jaaginema sp. PMC 1078.18]